VGGVAVALERAEALGGTRHMDPVTSPGVGAAGPTEIAVS
jgi:hypothetical protein